MEIKEALTFDDVLLVPNKSNILPNEANTQTLITRRISLNSPIMSSAMDTVTESRMAIALAQYGGIGVIHRNLKIKEQVACVNDVKRFESAIVYNPVTLRENQKLSEAKDLQKKLNELDQIFDATGLPHIWNWKRLISWKELHQKFIQIA